jgi:hypothetical protein
MSSGTKSSLEEVHHAETFAGGGKLWACGSIFRRYIGKLGVDLQAVSTHNRVITALRRGPEPSLCSVSIIRLVDDESRISFTRNCEIKLPFSAKDSAQRRDFA